VRLVTVIVLTLVTRLGVAAECSGASLDALKKRQYVEGPISLVDLKRGVNVTIGVIPKEILQRLEAQQVETDEIYFSRFQTNPESDDYWGYEQLILVRNGCVIYKAMLSHDN